MGYIFDALNKKNGQSSDDQAPSAETSDISTARDQDPSDQLGKAASLAELIADADTQATPNADSLRFSDCHRLAESDVNADMVADAEETPPAIRTNIPSIDHTPTISQDLNIDQPLQLPVATKPKASWWSKLLGQHLRGAVDDRLVAMTSPASAMSEEYRSIRTSILARHDNERHLVHTITSATPQEGKTITCVNLGLTFAELRNRKTIIIECDLRLPTFGKLLNCDADRPGLIDYLRGKAKVTDIVQQVEGSALHIIPAGGRVSDEAVQLISGQRMSQLIQGLRAKYDHVIIDTPPVLQLADAGILGNQSEEVLVVARMRRTPRPLVEQAISTLASYNAQVNGIIATDNPRSRGRGYGYKYGYRYGYGYAYGYTSDRKGRKRKRRDAA